VNAPIVAIVGYTLLRRENHYQTKVKILSRKPEATYKNSIHKYINKSNVYFASMGGGYVAGIPDVYYEGNAGCLWVEWKNFQVLPREICLLNQSGAAKLSPLQQQWLRRANKNNINTAVICGSPEGGCVFPKNLWEGLLSRESFINTTLNRKEIAEWITNQVYKE